MPRTSPSPAKFLDEMRTHAGEACALLKAIGNEDRLLVLCQLCTGPHTVGELEAALDIHQPTLSQQLAVLRQERLVTTERNGKYIRYSLANEAVVSVMRTLWEIYCAPEQDARRT